MSLHHRCDACRMLLLIMFCLMMLCDSGSTVQAERVHVHLSNEQLGASQHDYDILWCRDPKLWHWQVRQLLPWNADPLDMYRWKNQYADVYVDLNEHNMIQWFSGLPRSTYDLLFDFLRIRILYARYQARKASVLQLLRIDDQEQSQKVLPVHQFQTLNALYGPDQPYLHERHNNEIEQLTQYEMQYSTRMLYLKMLLASILLWINNFVLYQCFSRVWLLQAESKMSRSNVSAKHS